MIPEAVYAWNIYVDIEELIPRQTRSAQANQLNPRIRPLLPKSNLTPMRLWCNQKEVLKLHAFRRCASGQSDPSALPEEERDRVSQLHTREMNTDTRARSRAKRVERRSSIGRVCFGSAAFFSNPTLRVETCQALTMIEVGTRYISDLRERVAPNLGITVESVGLRVDGDALWDVVAGEPGTALRYDAR
jgi:hypothetical protein